MTPHGRLKRKKQVIQGKKKSDTQTPRTARAVTAKGNREDLISESRKKLRKTHTRGEISQRSRNLSSMLPMRSMCMRVVFRGRCRISGLLVGLV
jgi:hypothetical protein